MFANTQMGGMSLAFPDVILTPTPVGPVPVPAPNVSMGPMKVPAVYNVLVDCTPLHNLTTMAPLTVGDPVGVGAASATVLATGQEITGAFTALAGGGPMTKMTSISQQNLINAHGVALVPAQLKLLILAP